MNMMMMTTAMDGEIAHFEILLRTLSLGVKVEDTVSSSLTESLSPRSRGTEEEELPDTWKIFVLEFFSYLTYFTMFSYMLQTHRASNGVILPMVCNRGDPSSESGGERD